jgi:uncharacterized membrane protein
MRTTLVGFLVFGLLALGSLVQAFAYNAVLPDRVATEFGAAGVPRGWQSKGTLLLTHVGIVTGMAFGLLPLAYLGVRFGPAWMIDMPQKQYWLAEPRQRETRLSLARYVLWVLNLSFALMAAVMELTYRANLSERPHLGWGIWVCLAAFGLGIVVWMVRFYRRFRKVSD